MSVTWAPEEVESLLAHLPGMHNQADHGRKGPQTPPSLGPSPSLYADDPAYDRVPPGLRQPLDDVTLQAHAAVVDDRWPDHYGRADGVTALDEMRIQQQLHDKHQAAHPYEESLPRWNRMVADDTVEGGRKLVLDRPKYEHDVSVLARDIATAPIVVRTSPEAAMEIANDGRFQTQFEAGVSGGSYAPRLRAQMETVTMGADPTMPDEKRPIYGYVDSPLTDSDQTAMQYGTVKLVLADSVKARATMTFGDSLDESKTPIAMAAVLAGTTGAELHSAGQLTRSYARATERANGGVVADFTVPGYTEAQVWGGVQAHEVAKVVVHTYGPDDLEPARAVVQRYGKPYEIYGPGDTYDKPKLIESGGA